MKSYSKLVNRALLKEQLKRFWVIAALPLLAYLLFVVTPIYRDAGYDNKLSAINGVINTLRMSNPIVLLLSVVVPFTAALSLFSYQFNPRAAVAFNSYPVNRKQLFFTNLFAGFGLMIVPLVVFCLFLLIPVRFGIEEYMYVDIPAALYPHGLYGGDIVNTVPLVAAFFCRMAVTYVFYFALFTLASVLAGHGIVAALLCMAFPFVPVGIFVLDQAVKYWMVAGHSLNRLGGILTGVMIYSNPLGWAAAFNNGLGFGGSLSYYAARLSLSSGGFASEQWILMLTYIATVAVFIAAAYFLNKVRKQERTGDSVVFGPFKQVLIFLLSLAGGIMMFVFFLNIMSEGGTIIIAYVGFALGFTFAFFIAQMIAEKTFNVGYKFKSFIKFAAVMAVAYLLVFVSAKFDMNGFQKYVPDANSVAGIYILDNTNTERFGTDDYSGWVTDRDLIAETVESHKRTIANKDLLHKMIEYRLMGRSFYQNEYIRSQNVFYRLNSGEVVSRTYYLTEAMSNDYGWTDLRMDEAVILSDYLVLSNPDKVSAVRLDYQTNLKAAEADSEWESQNVLISNPSEIASLFAEIKKDVVNTGQYTEKYVNSSTFATPAADTVIQNAYASVSIELSGEEERAKSTDWTGTYRSSDSRPSVYLSLNQCENTLNWLEANGYVK